MSRRIVVGQIIRPNNSKPITTSVPSFTSVKFKANDEDVELNQTIESDKEMDNDTIGEEQKISPNMSRDNSPLKEQQKLSKRSSSLDDGPSGSTDKWRLLHELKGKITKTVEEKLSEIKSDKKKEQGNKLINSKDNSSISDSEECALLDKTTHNDADASPILASPESSTPEPETTNTPRVEISPPTDTEASPQRSFFKVSEIKNRIRPKLSELRQRRKKSINSENVGVVNSLETKNDEDEDVESAVEVQVDDEKITSEIIENSVKIKQVQSWSYLGQIKLILKLREIQILILWLFLCLFLPIPNMIRDVIIGALIMHNLHCLYKWFLQPSIQIHNNKALDNSIIIPDYNKLPILQVPAVHEFQHIQKYEGWMNELLDDYDPETYHINQTRSVYLKLEGSLLRVCLTRQKVRKRAMWNEIAPRLSFYHQRIFDISGCPVLLLPEGLARKRLWSKKYPICIVLKQDSRVGFSVPEKYKDAIDAGEDADIEEDDDDVQDENSEDDTFCMVTSSMVEQNQLYLFARTDRDKDDWIRRLVAATKIKSSPTSSDKQLNNDDSPISQAPTPPPPPLASPEIELHKHISLFLQQQVRKRRSSASKKSQLNNLNLKSNSTEEVKDEAIKDTAWFNAILSRVMFDVLRDPQWSEWVRNRIQRKLATVKLPTFMEELTVSELDLGVALPIVHRTSAPHMDERGLWVDLDVSYEGSASISVETKLNLVKLTKTDSLESSSGSNRDISIETKELKSPIFDSDMEDSAESSSDEDTQEASAEDSSAPSASGSSSGMGKMFIKMATKITSSKYFQQASEIRYIRRAMEEMSNTKVMVTVELKGLVGVLSINIPPPPSDRLWYGFRGNPELRLNAKAKLGERLVTLSQVTEFIESKLCVEFQKVFVLPNMDEIIIPVMNGKLPK